MHIAPRRQITQQVPKASPAVSVLYVLSAFPVLSETFISNEIRAMRALGNDCVPLALQNFHGACQPQDEGFRDETVQLGDIPVASAALACAKFSPAGWARALQFSRRQTGIPTRSLMWAALKTALVARAHGCTHIHAHFALPAAATAITAAKLAGLTSSFTGHGYDIYASPADLAMKLQNASFAVAVCEDMRRDFANLAPSARIAMVPCGIDPTLFRPRAAAAAPRNGRLLAIGRLCEQKGYDVLFAALAALPADRRPVIDIVGGGDLQACLRNQVAQLGIDTAVNFLGPQTSTWIAANGPQYGGFVAPYRICANGDRDTGPIVVKEALSMGLPVVASALMGLKESVNDRCGRLVAPGDVAALASALVWLTGLPESQICALGEAGRTHIAAHFSLAGQAQGLTAAIRAARS